MQACAARGARIADLPELHVDVVHGDEGRKERDDKALDALADFREADGDLGAYASDWVHANREDVGLETLEGVEETCPGIAIPLGFCEEIKLL